MKYKVKVNGLEILCDDFECETIDEPTYSCPLCGYILKSIDDHCEDCTKVEPKEESLEEKFCNYYNHICDRNGHRGEVMTQDLYKFAKIAKEHYQEHYIHRSVYDVEVTLNKHLDEEMEGMVSLDKVLEVFDKECNKEEMVLKLQLRKALEQLR